MSSGTVPIALRIPRELVQVLQERADAADRSLSAEVRQAVRRYLEGGSPAEVVARDGFDGALDVLRVIAERNGWVVSAATASVWLDILAALFDARFEVMVRKVALAPPHARDSGRCVCPVGWGSVADQRCPVHSGAPHTVTGADVDSTTRAPMPIVLKPGQGV